MLFMADLNYLLNRLVRNLRCCCFKRDPGRERAATERHSDLEGQRLDGRQRLEIPRRQPEAHLHPGITGAANGLGPSVSLRLVNNPSRTDFVLASLMLPLLSGVARNL